MEKHLHEQSPKENHRPYEGEGSGAESHGSVKMENYDDRTTLNQCAIQEGPREDLPKGHPHAA